MKKSCPNCKAKIIIKLQSALANKYSCSECGKTSIAVADHKKMIGVTALSLLMCFIIFLKFPESRKGYIFITTLIILLLTISYISISTSFLKIKEDIVK